MAGLTIDQLSASVDARLDNNSQNLLLWSGSFQTKLDELGITSINAFSGAISTSLNTLSSSVSALSTSFNGRINTIKSSELALSASVTSDVTSLKTNVDSLNSFSASITSSFNSLSSSVNSTSASFASRINTLRAGGVTFDDFNALTQSLSGVISSSAQLNNATITNLTITNLTTINETSSVIYSSGSNQFGDSLTDNHILSGSVKIVGSGSVNGYNILTTNDTASLSASAWGAFQSASSYSSSLATSISASNYNITINSASVSSLSSSFGSRILTIEGKTLVSGSSQIDVMSTTNITRLATTGSNSFNGTQTITGSLEVSDSILATGTIYPIKIWHGYGNDSDKKFNIAIGHNSLASNTSGTGNIALGRNALIGSSTGEGITAIGSDAGFYNTIAKQGTYLGKSAGYGTTTGDANTLLGYQAGYGISTGAYNTGVGLNSLYNNNGSNNVALGMNAGQYSSGSSESNVYIGYQAGPSAATTESNKLYINNNNGSPLIGGDFSAKTVTISGSLIVSGSGDALFLSGGQTVRLGRASLYTGTGAYDANVWLQGTQVGLAATTVVLDSNTIDVSGSMTISSSAAVDLKVIGNQTISGSLTVSSSAAVDLNVIGALNVTGSLKVSDSILATGTDYPLSIWHGTGDTKEYNVAIGHSTLASNTTGNGNVALGWTALVRNTTGQGVTAMGSTAGYYNTTGDRATYIGYAAGFNNITGDDNTFLGYQAGYGISTGNYNTSVGLNSLFNNNGSNNVSLGMNAGAYASGSSNSNVYIGNAAGPAVDTTESNKLYINNNNGSPLIGGDFSAKTVTISGSLLMSGSIVPAVGVGTATSSFSLGSETNAWKDIYVSNGTIKFMGSGGSVQGTLSSTTEGLALPSITVAPAPGAAYGNATINLNASANNSSFINYNADGIARFGAGSDASYNYRINSYTGDTFHGVAVLVPTGSTRVLLGGTFDDGANALQVNGSARFQTNVSISGSLSNGSGVIASGDVSHAEGQNTIASGVLSHSEGLYTTASAAGTHAEGSTTWASGPYSHAEGIDTKTVGQGSHAEGTGSWAGGNYSHAGGYGTRANEDYELAIGKFNAETYNGSLFVIGNGTNDGNRSNIVSVNTGSVKIAGEFILSPIGAPSSPASGSLYFSSADSHFYGWNGLTWKQLDN